MTVLYSSLVDISNDIVVQYCMKRTCSVDLRLTFSATIWLWWTSRDCIL